MSIRIRHAPATGIKFRELFVNHPLGSPKRQSVLANPLTRGSVLLRRPLDGPGVYVKNRRLLLSSQILSTPSAVQLALFADTTPDHGLVMQLLACPQGLLQWEEKEEVRVPSMMVGNLN